MTKGAYIGGIAEAREIMGKGDGFTPTPALPHQAGGDSGYPGPPPSGGAGARAALRLCNPGTEQLYLSSIERDGER